MSIKTRKEFLIREKLTKSKWDQDWWPLGADDDILLDKDILGTVGQETYESEGGAAGHEVDDRNRQLFKEILEHRLAISNKTRLHGQSWCERTKLLSSIYLSNTTKKPSLKLFDLCTFYVDLCNHDLINLSNLY